MVENDHQAELEQLRQELEATKKEKMELELAVGRVNIGRNWKEENNPFSKAWSELIQSQKLFL